MGPGRASQADGTAWAKTHRWEWQAGCVQWPVGGTTARGAQVQQDGRREQRAKAGSGSCARSSESFCQGAMVG